MVLPTCSRDSGPHRRPRKRPVSLGPFQHLLDTLLNANSTSENPNMLCVLLKSMPRGLFLMIFEVKVLVTVCERRTRQGEQAVNPEDRFPCCV